MNHTFEKYVDQLEYLAQAALTNFGTNLYKKNILEALDGGPRSALNRSIPLEIRRGESVFFTGSVLAQKTLNGVINQVNKSTIFLDPACGAGDLLLSCTQILPANDDLDLTLYYWGERIAGSDLRPEFVRAAKARLFLAALLRSKSITKRALSYSEQWFPLLRPGNIFEKPSSIQSASLIVINPPYHMINAPINCIWASGKVSSAALFTDFCISNAKPNSRIVAILPDVLRSGSRYAHWRSHILKKAQIEKISLFGQFDQWTDIHVFILQLKVIETKNSLAISWNKKHLDTKSNKIGDNFEVHVGSVVPHRNKEIGQSYPYIVAKNLPAWKTIVGIQSTRRFSGTVFLPPFVVVRRTSRPGDKYRAIGTIISGKKQIAIENHLIILKPKDKTLASCKRLLIILRKQETSDWLDNRIRCRHLTVSAMEELPW